MDTLSDDTGLVEIVTSSQELDFTFRGKTLSNERDLPDSDDGNELTPEQAASRAVLGLVRLIADIKAAKSKGLEFIKYEEAPVEITPVDDYLSMLQDHIIEYTEHPSDYF